LNKFIFIGFNSKRDNHKFNMKSRIIQKTWRKYTVILLQKYKKIIIYDLINLSRLRKKSKD